MGVRPHVHNFGERASTLYFLFFHSALVLFLYIPQIWNSEPVFQHAQYTWKSI